MLLEGHGCAWMVMVVFPVVGGSCGSSFLIVFDFAESNFNLSNVEVDLQRMTKAT